MEDIKLVKKVTGVTTEGRSKNKQGNKVMNYLKKLKLRNWSQLVKDRKGWNYLVQKTKTHVELQCQKKKEEKKRSGEECEIFFKNQRKTFFTSNSRGFHYSGRTNIFLVQRRITQDLIKRKQISAQISVFSPAVKYVSQQSRNIQFEVSVTQRVDFNTRQIQGALRSHIWGSSGESALLLSVHGAFTAGINQPERDVGHLPQRNSG